MFTFTPLSAEVGQHPSYKAVLHDYFKTMFSENTVICFERIGGRRG